MGQNIGKWNSAQSQREYEIAYKEAMQKMPRTEAWQIETSFGVVQVYCWKNDDSKQKTPILLLPGKSSGTPMWSENLPDFYKNRTVYGIDILGDAGLSIQTKTIKNSADQAKWIEELLSKLDLHKIHLLGHSFGGWLAANYASNYPERIASLILIEPVFTFQTLKLVVILKSIPYSLKFLPKKWRQGFLKMVSGSDSIDTSDPVAKMIDVGSNYKSKLPTPVMITKKQLQSWNFPVYAALADRSAMHNSLKAIEVAKNNVKNIHTVLWKNATHSLPVEYAESLDAEIIKFIEVNEN